MPIIRELYKAESATNNIVSLYITESIGLSATFTANTNTPDILTVNNNNNQNVQVVVVKDATSINLAKVNHLSQFQMRATTIGDKYEGFRTVKESKLLMYPYSVTLLDDFKGNRIEIKQEYIMGDYLTLQAKGSLGTSNHVSYGIQAYNQGNIADALAISNESALINSNPNDVPIVTDMLSAYLQGNRNSIQHQKQATVVGGVFDVLGGLGAQASIGAPATALASGDVSDMIPGMSIAKGMANTVLAIQGIEAKQKDISNLPPQIAKMGTNTAYDFGNGYQGIYIIKKQIKPEYQRQLEDYFNMFGYKVNRVKMPNFHTRQNWNFVQTVSCTIIANLNNEDLQEIKNVFDNGITLWHTDDIGNYLLDNEVI